MEPWNVYVTLGGVIVAMATYVKSLHNRIDTLQEQYRKFVEKALTELKEAKQSSDEEGGSNGA